MKRFFMRLLAIAFPWVILLLNDNPGGAIIALIMQATIIGWVPAAIWATNVLKEQHPPKRRKKVDATELKPNDTQREKHPH